MAITNGEMLAFFPTPYPDETLYSVLCRLYLRLNCLSYRQISEKFLERRVILNAHIPQCISPLISHLPDNTGITSEYFINRTTMFPYFAPFLTRERQDIFFKYMTKRNTVKGNNVAIIGTNTMRQPKNLFLRFCKSCWRDDIQNFGEEYWHRIHQLPGVLMCHHHKEPLLNSPILISTANRGFYVASMDMIEKSNVCGNFKENTAEKLMLLSQNSQFLLENGCLYESYEKTRLKYDLWLSSADYSSRNGHIRHKEIHLVANDLYGEEFLKLVDAYDKDAAVETWSKRILKFPYKLSSPMYHILLHILLAGSTMEFLDGDYSKPLQHVKKNVQKRERGKSPVLTENEKSSFWRQKWEELISEYPDANRSYLSRLAPTCYDWLRKNDLIWFANHLPMIKGTAHFDWDAHDLEVLEKVREVVNALRNTVDKPIWISRRRIARQTEMDRIRSKNVLARMPKTAAYLSANVESREDWHRRILVWEKCERRKADELSVSY